MAETEKSAESQDPMPATEIPPTEVDPPARAPSVGATRASARLAAEAASDVPAKGSVSSQKARAVAAPRRSSRPPAPAASQPPASLGALALPSDPLGAYEALARAPRLADLVALTSKIVGGAAQRHATSFAFGAAEVEAAAEEARLSHADATTAYGDALDVLARGADTPPARALACALWAHAVAEAPRKRTEDEDGLVADILWLAARSAFDATMLLDRALGDEAGELWTAMAGRIRRIARGRSAPLGRPEMLVGVAALAASSNERAAASVRELGRELAADPVLSRLLTATDGQAGPATGDVRLEGELLPAPRGPVATAVLACTGLLFAVHAVRLVGRLALAYRRPAEVSLTDGGIRVTSRTELLGRTLREREQVIVRAGLVRVVREVRYPRAAFYAGLLALAVGSWLGVRTFVDGARSASPSLLVVGLVIVAAGIAADFVLGSLVPGTRGRVRVLFVPKSGATLCVGDVDARRADDALARALARP